MSRNPPTGIPERFEHLVTLISSRRFLRREGLGNEVPFYICPFDPSEAPAMQQMQQQLANSLRNDHGLHVLEINLYDLCIGLLQERGIWQRLLAAEAGVTKAQFRELLQSVLDPENHLIPAISQKLHAQRCDVLLIGGVGEVFPYIRSHNVLNNLQSTAAQHPVVLFFPGAYTQSLEHGASLDLFGRLHDDKYYRAFNIFEQAT